MAPNDAESIPGFVDGSIAAFKRIIANNQKDMWENMNRANKGELFILHFLSMREGASLPSELSLALHSSAARISALLSSLEKKGQIQREIDRGNRRNILVTITEAGAARAEQEMQRMDESLGRVFLTMGERDVAEFLRLSESFYGLMHEQIARERSLNQ